MEWELLRIEYINNVKFLVYINENGDLKKERISNYIFNEENINIFNEDNKQEWELEYEPKKENRKNQEK